jgi:hypothetical protein
MLPAVRRGRPAYPDVLTPRVKLTRIWFVSISGYTRAGLKCVLCFAL